MKNLLFAIELVIVIGAFFLMYLWGLSWWQYNVIGILFVAWSFLADIRWEMKRSDKVDNQLL